MHLRLTINGDFEVCDVVARMGLHALPSRVPWGVVSHFERLKGLRIGRGWNRKVREVLGGAHGCTHLVEMLAQLATVALQTVRPYKRAQVREKLRAGEEDSTTSPTVADQHLLLVE